MPRIEELLDCRVRKLKLFKAMTVEGETVVEHLAALEASGQRGGVRQAHPLMNPVEALRKYYEWERASSPRALARNLGAWRDAPWSRAALGHQRRAEHPQTGGRQAA
uniref:Uncharacterized protein n=1 Tax=Thermofilum pendens TaxID=2269 RepID=A0A7J3X6J3_THEPE